MIIDDILDPLKQMGQVAEDLIFTTHRSGTMYTYMEFLVVKRGQDEVPIPYPCNISISGSINSESTKATSGTDNNPVMITGFNCYTFTISFEAGDFRVPLYDVQSKYNEGGVIRANRVIKELVNLIRKQDGDSTIEIIQGSTVKEVPQIRQKFFGQLPMFEQKPSLLRELEIRNVVIQSISINPVANHRYQVSMSGVSVEGETKLFMTLDEYKVFKAKKGGG